MATAVSRVSISRAPNSNVYKQNIAGPGYSGKNHFDKISGFEPNRRSTRASSSPAINRLHNRSPQSSNNGHPELVDRQKHEVGFQESGSCENQTLEKLENYAVCEAEETTQKINCCLKVAEEIREDATRTLVNLHRQGHQITRTHLTAASIDQDLSRGEKLLGSLGGLFSKPWKPKKSREIQGPVLRRADSFTRRGNHMEQRQKLGLTPRSQSNPRQIRTQPASALKRVELEKENQEAALSGLSNLLFGMKAMAVDMGAEIDRQNKALDHMGNDVDELNFRIKGANLRARRLLRS